ncbi:MAG: hypothetical protein MNPFHGCM_01430 [Gemmatimonadaceae bacterium]|nr:hypothetical protein [Gemmatimonadaceae bacterium]
MSLVTGGEVAVTAIVFGTLSGTIITLVRLRYSHNLSKRQPYPDTAVDERLQRIEQAVDAIAIEVERMSESQRFVTKVLAERLPAPDRAVSLPSRGEGSS